MDLHVEKKEASWALKGGDIETYFIARERQDEAVWVKKATKATRATSVRFPQYLPRRDLPSGEKATLFTLSV